MIVRGPGISPGSQVSFPATHVDFGATFLAMAGLTKPATMDGKSFLPMIVNASTPQLPASVVQGLGDKSAEDVADGWRDMVFVEHYRVGAGSYCGTGHHIDGMDNNFIAIRTMPGSKFGNFLYAEFQWANGTNYGMGNVDFKSPFLFEAFDMDKDPWQVGGVGMLEFVS